MSERSKYGLLGFGAANPSAGAHLANCGLPGTVWTLPCHQSTISLHREDGNKHANDSNGLKNAHPFEKAASLEELVSSHDCLILAAPADEQGLYIAALEEVNHLLKDTILLVIGGSKSTALARNCLNVKHVIESNLPRPVPGPAHDKPATNGHGQKVLNPCSQLEYGSPPNPEPGLPENARSLLHDLTRFSAEVPTGLGDVLASLLRHDRPIESFGEIAQYGSRDAPVVTMFSGGLDSTYLLLKLQQLGFTNVHAVAVDVGGPIDEDHLTKSAAHFGATFVRRDGRELFAQKHVVPAIRAHAKYMGMYPVSSSLSRPVIARLTAEYAKTLDAGLLLHTANLSQNSLPRLNNSIQHCGFLGHFGSPYVRSVVSREQKARELAAVGMSFKTDCKLSGDENLWCREFEAGPLDDPEGFDIPEDAYQWTTHCGGHLPEKLTLTFEKGDLVSVNGDRLPLIQAIALLNKEVGKFGHGRYVSLEPIRTDEKVLEVREAPAATIIMDALRHLEVATLESNTLNLKQYLEQKWVAEAISGRWGSSCHTMCGTAISSALESVGGSVTYHIDHARYLPCSIVADNPRYIRDRDQWEYEESLRTASPKLRF